MFLFILFALLCLKIKGYKVMPVLKAYPLYPYVFVQIIYLILQLNIFWGNYDYIKYASVFKNVYLFTLIIPILVYKLYKTGFLGAACIIIGTILNKFVMSQNGGKMPVFASLSKLTGYYDESVFQTIDNIHIVGNETTKYKFLSDFIDVGYSVLSIGDLLIHSLAFIVIYNVIRETIKLQKMQKTVERDTLYGDT